MSEHRFVGEHVIAELYGIDSHKIKDNELLMKTLRIGIDKSGAKCENEVKKEFYPQGFSAVVLLSESHASIHTYPDKCAAFVDAFTCGEKCKPHLIVQELIQQLEANESTIRIIKRGNNEL